MVMGNKPRIGIIGCGQIAKIRHVPELAKSDCRGEPGPDRRNTGFPADGPGIHKPCGSGVSLRDCGGIA